MERREAESLGDILRQAIEESSKAHRYDEFTAINLWPAVIGSNIADKTLKPTVKDGVMTVKVPSAALRQELNMTRSAIAEALNREVGKNVIKDLRFI